MAEQGTTTPGTQPQPVQIIPLPVQGAAAYVNHILATTDGLSVFLTFYQASPSTPGSVSPPQPGMESKAIPHTAPMIATPVAKVALSLKVIPQMVKTLQEIARITEQQSP